jgi:hypothetical protein
LGRYSPFNISSSCLSCDPGKITNITGKTVCSICDIGTYASEYNSSSCRLCNSGLFSNFSAASFCYSCIPGFYANLNGSTVCTVCSIGTYSSSYSLSKCENCAKGKFNDGSYLLNSTVEKVYPVLCSDCSRGRWSDLGVGSCERFGVYCIGNCGTYGYIVAGIFSFIAAVLFISSKSPWGSLALILLSVVDFIGDIAYLLITPFYNEWMLGLAFFTVFAHLCWAMFEEIRSMKTRKFSE